MSTFVSWLNPGNPSTSLALRSMSVENREALKVAESSKILAQAPPVHLTPASSA